MKAHIFKMQVHFEQHIPADAPGVGLEEVFGKWG